MHKNALECGVADVLRRHSTFAFVVSSQALLFATKLAHATRRESEDDTARGCGTPSSRPNPVYSRGGAGPAAAAVAHVGRSAKRPCQNPYSIQRGGEGRVMPDENGSCWPGRWGPNVSSSCDQRRLLDVFVDGGREGVT